MWNTALLYVADSPNCTPKKLKLSLATDKCYSQDQNKKDEISASYTTEKEKSAYKIGKDTFFLIDATTWREFWSAQQFSSISLYPVHFSSSS